VSDVVLGAIIGAAAAVVGGIVVGLFDLIGRRQDREHDSTERAAEREAAAAARREERTATERALWRERAAVTLGQVFEFAVDVNPAGATALIPQEYARTRADELAVKWQALRGPFGVLIVGLPTLAERDLAEDVLERFRKVHNGLSWVLIRDIDTEGKWDSSTILELHETWELANAGLHELREAIHGTSSREAD
jgi:hypothetical protein